MRFTAVIAAYQSRLDLLWSQFYRLSNPIDMQLCRKAINILENKQARFKKRYA